MKKEHLMRARLPRGLLRDLQRIEDVEQSDRSTTIRKLLSKAIRDWKLEHSAKLYGEGRLTLARAARDADVSLWEMMDYARLRRIPAQYDIEDLERDLRGISARLAGR